MCGIVGTFGGNPIADTLKAYHAQKSRGTEGYGYLALKHGKIVDFQRTITEREIKQHLHETEAMNPDCILFHHRFPTSTANVPESAHPLPISKKGWTHKYYMLHNGVVSGEDDDDIEKAGYIMRSRVSEVKYYRAGKKTYEMTVDSEVNDSEYLGFYVAQLLEGDRKDIPMSGAIACIVLREHKQTKECTVFAMRNFMNPLQVHRVKEKGAHTLRLSSEGEGASLEAGIIHALDWKTLTFSEYQKVEIGKSFGYSSSGGLYSGYESYYGEDYRGIGTPAKGTGVLFPKVKDDMDKLNDKLLEMEKTGGKGESIIIGRELEKLTREADKAYSELEEAKAMLEGDDSPEAKSWIAELQKTWEEAEEARDELQESEKMPF